MADDQKTIVDADRSYQRRSHGGGAGGIDRPTSRNLSALSALWPYLKRRPVTVGLAILFLVLAACATLAMPMVLGGVVDALGRSDVDAINASFRTLFAVVAGLAFLSASRFYFVARFGERVAADLRSDLYTHMMGLSPRFYADLKTGEAVSRLTADVTLIETFFGSSLSLALRTILTTVGSLALLFVVNWRLASILVLVIPMAMIPIMLIGRSVRSRSSRAQDRLADAASEAVETLENIEIVQAFGEEQSRTHRFVSAAEAAFDAALSRIRARSFMTAAAFLIIFAGTVLILWLGALAVADGRMTGGALTQFIAYAVFAASGAGMLSEVFGDAMRASGAAARTQQILSEQPDIIAPATPKSLPSRLTGNISFEAVSFGYGASKASALDGLSFTVNPGELVALVGPSGAGKSTIFRLLLRLYDPDNGRISIDGVDARDVDPIAWRRSFAYVAQESALFSGTVLENLAFGSPEATETQLREAAISTRVDGFVQEKGGYDSLIGPRGKSLSGGERQRLALARALVRDAPILLLDEATSALDSENEQFIQDALSVASEGRTTLVIAHRLSTVRKADRIIVIDQGRMAEMGTHSELMEMGGVYARLAELQFGHVD